MELLNKIADGRTDLIVDALDAGLPVNSTDTQGIALIKWAAYYGDVTAIKYLLLRGESIDSLGENFGLHQAAFHGHWQLCQYLVEQGAAVNFQLPDTGETPLHSALCKANRPVYNKIVELLLKYGADPNSRTLRRKGTGSFMRDVYTREETPLHRAAAYGDEQTIQLLLNAGADKTLKDMNGDTPLTWASWHLRTGKILSMLCYGEYTIHPERVKAMVSDHGAGWGNGMENNLSGRIHF